MDENILVKIGSFIDDKAFLNYMKAFPFLISPCNHFKMIYNINVNPNKRIDGHLIIQNPNDISLYERIVNIVKKTIKCKKMVILNDIRYFTFSFIDIDHDFIFKDLKRLKEKRSIKCRNPKIFLWFSDYDLIVNNNFYEKINWPTSDLKIIILGINNDFIPLSKSDFDKSDVYIYDDYIKIKL